MSFIGAVDQGKAYAPGYFLAHEECERKTRLFEQDNAEVVTTAEGAKYVPMGAFYPANDSSKVEGIVYEDVDVTNGDMPGSVVLSGVVYLDRLPEAPDSGVASALAGKGFTFVDSAPSVTRPDWAAVDGTTEGNTEGDTEGNTDGNTDGTTEGNT